MNDAWTPKRAAVAPWIVRAVQASSRKDARNLALELGVTTRSVLDAQALIAEAHRAP